MCPATLRCSVTVRRSVLHTLRTEQKQNQVPNKARTTAHLYHSVSDYSVFFFFTVSRHFLYLLITAAWTPAWQTPPVRACSVVLQTAGGAVAL